ncbi:MAG TPA: hypothetical protein VNH20_03735 [Candidatus Dormibacteraeota bacterium]|nr:hypothetical protein [Candidatus Dormibacteraeota bacterium]
MSDQVSEAHRTALAENDRRSFCDGRALESRRFTDGSWQVGIH